MECKQCKSDRITKNGQAKNKQRYHCKSCGVNFVQGDGRRGKNEEKKKLAIKLYLENMAFRAIGRVGGMSNVAVLKVGQGSRRISRNIPPSKKPPRANTCGSDGIR